MVKSLLNTQRWVPEQEVTEVDPSVVLQEVTPDIALYVTHWVKLAVLYEVKSHEVPPVLLAVVLVELLEIEVSPKGLHAVNGIDSSNTTNHFEIRCSDFIPLFP